MPNRVQERSPTVKNSKPQAPMFGSVSCNRGNRVRDTARRPIEVMRDLNTLRQKRPI